MRRRLRQNSSPSDMSDVIRASAGDVRRAAIDLLARREHSCQELTAKLARRFVDADADMIARQIDRLTEGGYQSDRRFCEMFVRYRSQRGQGPHRVGQELSQRGVSDRLVQELLWDASIDWRELLAGVYQRRYGGKKVSDQKERAKRHRFLQYRGFDFEMIRQLPGL